MVLDPNNERMTVNGDNILAFERAIASKGAKERTVTGSMMMPTRSKETPAR
jgi:hypothetical protein